MQEGWLIGPEAIRKHFIGYNMKSLRGLVKYGFPLRTMPNGDPAVIISEANKWLQEFSENTSPFQLRPLSGAALAAHNGVKIGGMLNNEAAHKAAVERDNVRVLREARGVHREGALDLFGQVPHGSVTDGVSIRPNSSPSPVTLIKPSRGRASARKPRTGLTQAGVS